MSQDEDHIVHEALAQELKLDIGLSGIADNPVTEGGPIFMNLRPLRATADPTLIPRIKHFSSFISDTVYQYLDDTLFSRVFNIPTPTTRVTPESALSPHDSHSTTTDPASNVIEFPIETIQENLNAALIQIDNRYDITADERRTLRYQTIAQYDSLRVATEKRLRSFQKEQKNWTGEDPYTLLYAPFYILSHPSESATEATRNPKYRALPILAPNLPERDVDRCRFLAYPSATYPDQTHGPIQTQNDLTPFERTAFTNIVRRENARVFVALWLMPTFGRMKISGWRAAEKYKATTFRLRPRTAETRLRIREQREEKRFQREQRRLIADPTLAGSRPSPSPENRDKDALKRKHHSSTGQAIVIAAASPELDYRDLDTNPDFEFDVGAQVIDYFTDALLRPEESPSGSTVRGLEPPCDEESGGIVAILELPRYYSEFFAAFSLQKPTKNLNAQQERREKNHRRRPERPAETYAVIAPSGVTRIFPSISHLSLILPPNISPTEAKLRCRRQRTLSSQLAVTIFVDPEGEAGKTTGGRNCAPTTLPAELFERLNIAERPVDPSHPHYFFLDEPPLLTLPPTDDEMRANPDAPRPKSGRPELTLVFRSAPFDHKNPLRALPDGEFLLDE